MSMDEREAAEEEWLARFAEELYPDHKSRAIEEFTSARLQSFYIQNSMLMRPAVDSYQMARRLREADHHAPPVVFFVTAIELFPEGDGAQAGDTWSRPAAGPCRSPGGTDCQAARIRPLQGASDGDLS